MHNGVMRQWGGQGGLRSSFEAQNSVCLGDPCEEVECRGCWAQEGLSKGVRDVRRRGLPHDRLKMISGTHGSF